LQGFVLASGQPDLDPRRGVAAQKDRPSERIGRERRQHCMAFGVDLEIGAGERKPGGGTIERHERHGAPVLEAEIPRLVHDPARGWIVAAQRLEFSPGKRSGIRGDASDGRIAEQVAV
jgi:hypothetical protein